MPDIKVSEVLAYSSEDPSFPAKNLLCTESYKKWKSKSAGEKEVSVLLKFENSSQIEAVHIGNEGSAFVEILVGKLGEDVKDFQVLLPTSSFMSPAESRAATNPARVRMFGRDKLAAAALDRPWECARVVCTQPFCRTAAYGLSFVRFRCAEPAQPRQQQPTRLGAFTLRPEGEDNIRAGGLFNRRAELAASNGGGLKRDDRSDRVVPPRRPAADTPGAEPTSTARPPSDQYQLKKPLDSRPTALPDTANRNNASPSTSATDRSSDRQRAAGVQGRTEATPKRPLAAPKKQEQLGTTPRRDQRTSNGASANSTPSSGGAAGAAPNNSGAASATPRPPPNAVFRPFGKLLSGVVFAMSGYQNPRRSELREQGIKLGAVYRPDWGPGCTHLICAFRNTPKFTAVRGQGKIVRGEWLSACVKQKRRLPWRRFSTDPADGRLPDSGDELWAEELRPPPPPGSSAPPPPAAGDGDDEYGGSTDGEDEIDTDDEIRMAQEEMAKAPTSVSSRGDAKKNEPEPGQSAGSAGDPGGRGSPATRPTAKRATPSPTPAAKRAARRSPSPADSDAAYDADTDEDEAEAPSRRPDTAGRQLPELADFLRGRTFLLYGDAMAAETRRQAARVVTAFGGRLEEYFGDSVGYVITEDAWDENFNEAAADHPELMFVRPAWLEACARRGKFVSFQPYMVTAGV